MGRKGKNFKRVKFILIKVNNKVETLTLNKNERLDKDELHRVFKPAEKPEDKKENKQKKVQQTINLENRLKSNDSSELITISDSYFDDSSFMNDTDLNDDMIDNMFIDKEQDLFFEINNFHFY